MKRLSIIVPCGRPETAAETIDSILRQTVEPDDLELILVGRGVTALANQTAGQHGFVKTVELPERRNPAATRMVGVEAATGDGYLFIDDDIRLAPDFLDHLLQHTRETGEAVFGARLPGTSSSYMSRVVDLANFWSQQSPRPGPRDWLYSAALYVPAAAYHAVGGFNAELTVGEDIDLTRRLAEGGWPVFYCPDLVARHDHRRITLSRALTYFWGNGRLERCLTPPGPELERFSLTRIARHMVGNARTVRRENPDYPGLWRLMPAVGVMYGVFGFSLEVHRHTERLAWLLAHPDCHVPVRRPLAERLLTKARHTGATGDRKRALAFYLMAGFIEGGRHSHTPKTPDAVE